MPLTISNLYPRPDEPDRGLFNMQFFRELAAALSDSSRASPPLTNICLVPTWRPWRRRAIRAWTPPAGSNHPTRYLPVAYLPVLGRDLSWLTYAAALRKVCARRWNPATVSATVAAFTWTRAAATAAALLGSAQGKGGAVIGAGQACARLPSLVGCTTTAAAARSWSPARRAWLRFSSASWRRWGGPFCPRCRPASRSKASLWTPPC